MIEIGRIFQRFNQWVFVAALIIIVSGCVALKAPFAPVEMDSTAKRFSSVSGKSVIYIYSKPRKTAYLAKYPIIMNGLFVGYLSPTTYFRMEVDPGVHDIWVNKVKGQENDSLLAITKVTVRAEEGQIYFVQHTFKNVTFSGHPKLELVDEKIGKEDVSISRMLLPSEQPDGTLYH
jgi:hypothetical protein